ncbi:MAG: aldo/keto reductase [Cellvibrionaceae bacterium]|nr:aldo/keto reductase [Cellvibrionaceae bacterium]
MTVSRAPLCHQGLEVSQLMAGFWRLKHWGMNAQELLGFIEAIMEMGVTTMDHAMVYRSEAPFGAALALKPSLRQQMEIVTKCGIRPAGFGPLGASHTSHYDSGHEAIVESVEASLRDLGTDYIDVLLLHRPDYLMDVHEVAEAFAALKAQGKVRYFGVSNFSPAQFEALQNIWGDGLVTNQIELSPYHLQALDSGVLEQCAGYGVRPMLWSCLAAGSLLTPVDAKGQRLLTALQKVREETGAGSVEQVVYAWVLALPCRPVPLLGSSKLARIADAVKALSLSLTREQWYSIWEASNGAPVS